MVLLDTCILIDILRGHPGALQLGKRVGNDVSISVISIQELFAGIRPGEEEQVEALLARARQIPVNAAIARQSGDYMRQYFRSHNVESNDSLIAATATVEGLELITCNRKHFPMFPDLKRPYAP